MSPAINCQVARGAAPPNPQSSWNWLQQETLWYGMDGWDFFPPHICVFSYLSLPWTEMPISTSVVFLWKRMLLLLLYCVSCSRVEPSTPPHHAPQSPPRPTITFRPGGKQLPMYCVHIMTSNHYAAVMSRALSEAASLQLPFPSGPVVLFRLPTTPAVCQEWGWRLGGGSSADSSFIAVAEIPHSAKVTNGNVWVTGCLVTWNSLANWLFCRMDQEIPILNTHGKSH